jgi:DNA-binding NarL/FixJ family response regulator
MMHTEAFSGKVDAGFPKENAANSESGAQFRDNGCDLMMNLDEKRSGRIRDVVLVVDDSPDTLRLLTDALEEARMTVLVALDGTLALGTIDKVVPDVILMDAVMPGMDGFETCRRLKRHAAVSHVPVIFMTGLSETEHIIEALEAGGVDYVTKPIVPDELLARIRVHLANARRAHSAHAALDASGRFLIATDQSGHMESFVLPPDARAWLGDRMRDPPGASDNIVVLRAEGLRQKLQLSYVGQIGPDEILLRLIDGDAASDELALQHKFSLTLRESEVLKWIARGKSNRDIAEILSLSPRTVNKHLDNIYAKLGVENRTAAAALAVRAVSMR